MYVGLKALGLCMEGLIGQAFCGAVFIPLSLENMHRCQSYLELEESVFT